MNVVWFSFYYFVFVVFGGFCVFLLCKVVFKMMVCFDFVFVMEVLVDNFLEVWFLIVCVIKKFIFVVFDMVSILCF